MKIYDVYTTLDPDTLTDVAMLIMKKWIDFSLGFETIGGHRVRNPTGRMASSIRVEGRGINHVMVIADAPEAEILEEGHDAVDLKQYLDPGRVYPMHRGTEMFVYNAAASARTRNVWAAPRATGFNGFARLPANPADKPGSWVIPAMRAWSPAQHLVDMLNNGSLLQ